MLTDRQALGFKDVLISPNPSDIKSRQEVSLSRQFTFSNGTVRTLVPIVAANMQGIGTFKTARVLSQYQMLTCIHKNTPLAAYQANYQLYPQMFPYVIPTVGLNGFHFIDALLAHHIPFDFLCLDVANGYMKQFREHVKEAAIRYPELTIIAGNVATCEGAANLYEAGPAEIVKVGIGSGSVCTTRYKTGVGIPQITAIDECSKYLERTMDGLLMSDGGCTCPGDVAKAFVAGADFVMLGGMLAGTQETGSTIQGSAFNGVAEYKTSEGKRINIQKPLQSLDDRVKDVLGGLRSAGSYIGQRHIENFYQADLVRVNEQTNNWLGPPE